MKKLLISLLVVLLLGFAPAAFAVESVAQSTKFYKEGFTVHTYTVTSAANGSVTSTATLEDDASTAFPIVGMIVMVEINPGGTAPSTGAWDVNLATSDGVQILGTGADDLSGTVSTAVAPKPTLGNMDGNYFSNGQLTMSIDDNVVNSATFTVRIFYYRYK